MTPARRALRFGPREDDVLSNLRERSVNHYLIHGASEVVEQRKDEVEGPPHCRRAAADNTMRNIHIRHFRGSQPSSP